MSWYLKILLSSNIGEYWIDTDGEIYFADGDVGEYNHEAYMIEMAQQDIMNGESDDWESWKNEKIQEKMQETGIQDPQEALMAVLTDYQIEEDLYDIAEGIGDAREIGMRHYGWKRLQDHNVETWTLTSNDLRAIANGLADAFFTSTGRDNYEKLLNRKKFNIFVYQTQKWYHGVPFMILKQANPSALQQYDSFSSGY